MNVKLVIYERQFLSDRYKIFKCLKKQKINETSKEKSAENCRFMKTVHFWEQKY